MKTIDRYDRHVLQLLQEDADLTVSDIAERVGLSTNACWRRIKRLEEQNVIRQHVVLLSEKTLGLNLTVFVSIKTNEHNDNWLKRFAAGVKAIPEVVEFYRISGATDYLLKIITRDIQDYDRVYKKTD